METFTQQQKVLKYLQTHRAMTTYDARNKLDVMHPASRVQELKAKGHKIITHFRWVSTGQAKNKVGEYVLIQTNLDEGKP